MLATAAGDAVALFDKGTLWYFANFSSSQIYVHLPQHHKWVYLPCLWLVSAHNRAFSYVSTINADEPRYEWPLLNVHQNHPKAIFCCSRTLVYQRSRKKRLLDFSNTIYDIAHAASVKDYWLSKSWLSEDTSSDITWESIGKAVKEIGHRKRVLVSKHVIGMHGVGKFM